MADSKKEKGIGLKGVIDAIDGLLSYVAITVHHKQGDSIKPIVRHHGRNKVAGIHLLLDDDGDVSQGSGEIHVEGHKVGCAYDKDKEKIVGGLLTAAGNYIQASYDRHGRINANIYLPNAGR